jgi:hypothetical protein
LSSTAGKVNKKIPKIKLSFAYFILFNLLGMLMALWRMGSVVGKTMRRCCQSYVPAMPELPSGNACAMLWQCLDCLLAMGG